MAFWNGVPDGILEELTLGKGVLANAPAQAQTLPPGFSSSPTVAEVNGRYWRTKKKYGNVLDGVSHSPGSHKLKGGKAYHSLNVNAWQPFGQSYKLGLPINLPDFNPGWFAGPEYLANVFGDEWFFGPYDHTDIELHGFCSSMVANSASFSIKAGVGGNVDISSMNNFKIAVFPFFNGVVDHGAVFPGGYPFAIGCQPGVQLYIWKAVIRVYLTP